MISIEVRSLSKSFGDTVALDAIDLKIEPGELFFLLGPSGCGKTTLLRALAGFNTPEIGDIFFGAEKVNDLPPHKRNTGMVFQSYALWPHMTVADNVAFGLKEQKLPKAEIKARTQEALAAVMMADYGNRKPNQLSGGQQQRIALARALVVRPRCLLLDEPLSNLDAKLRNEMRIEIRRVCKEYELTTVYVTHDQKEALSIADRLAVLRRGKILQVGTPQAVYRRPQSRFVANFIGEANFISGTVVDTGGGMAAIKTELGVLSGTLAQSAVDLEAGMQATCVIRPESLKIETYQTEENCIPGKVGDATYFGEVAQYQFDCGDVPLKVFELNPRFMWGDRGQQLFVWADSEDVVVLKD
ncbi:MAG: ABC transporter ATP-binding protein [Verrucomicrobia bacterium]|nr:ABC transporter ATP-binding protein [Verrucomicrobiota bacterium]MDA1068138.1 ABC transporter ATP-binding protein [Verrucomicrobiota bacterium]